MRQSLKDILKHHFQDGYTVFYYVLYTVFAAVVLHYAIMPYLTSVSILPPEIMRAHDTPVKTFVTLCCFRLLLAMTKPR